MAIFDGLSESEVRTAYSVLRDYRAARGEVLLNNGVEEGASIVALGCPVEFRHHDGTVLAVAAPGAVAGISQVVWNGRRMPHAVHARDAGDVLVLTRDALQQLQTSGHAAASNWEVYALGQITEHYRRLNEAINEVLHFADDASEPSRSSMLDELLALAGVAEMLAEPVPVDQVLAASALFADAPPEALHALEPAFVQAIHERGTWLGEQFRYADTMHFVVDGEVELAATEHGGEQVVVARARAGALVGFACVLGSVRLSHLITARRTTILSMRAADVLAITAEHSPRGRALRMALLRATSDVLCGAEVRVRTLMLARDEARRREAAEFMDAGEVARATSTGFQVRGV